MSAPIPLLMPQGKRKWRREAWKVLTELEFITAFFTWLFMAASRLAEPLMSLSAIYIILCAGIPAWNVSRLYELSLAFMIAAPEVILPGAFVLAGQASERGDRKAWAFHSVAWLFVCLTFVTLADLFIFHLGGVALNVLMWTRCAVGIGYSVLLRVMTYGQSPLHQPSPGHLAPALDYQNLAQHFQALSAPPVPAPLIDYQAVAQAIAPLVMPRVEAMRTTIREDIKATIAPLSIGASEPVPLSRSELLPLPPLEPVPVVAPSTKSQSHSDPLAPLEKEIESLDLQHQRKQDELVLALCETSVTTENHMKLEPTRSATRAISTQERLEAAYQELLQEGARLSGRALAERARSNCRTATAWLAARAGATHE